MAPACPPLFDRQLACGGLVVITRVLRCWLGPAPPSWAVVGHARADVEDVLSTGLPTATLKRYGVAFDLFAIERDEAASCSFYVLA